MLAGLQLTKGELIKEQMIQFQPNTAALLSLLCFSVTPQILSTPRPRIIVFSLISTANDAVQTEPLHTICIKAEITCVKAHCTKDLTSLRLCN